MTAPYTETTSAWPQSQVSETIKLYQEGIMAGTCGAATLSLWFFILDMLAGHPLSTPHVLGTALFKTGGWGFVPSARVEFSLGIALLIPSDFVVHSFRPPMEEAMSRLWSQLE